MGGVWMCAAGFACAKRVTMELIISLIAGALGGNADGAVLKNFSLGTLGNSLVGVLGGGLGGQLLTMMGAGGVAAAAGGGVDLA